MVDSYLKHGEGAAHRDSAASRRASTTRVAWRLRWSSYGSAFVRASLDCSGASIGGLLGTDGEAAGFDEWYHWHSDFVSAPVGTQSILLDLISRKNDATGTFVAYWDDIFVIPEPAAALLQGAALGALAALGRRRRAQR